MSVQKVGIALGAGAARGLANLGVLQVLEEHKIPIQIVCGTSAGALVAALYSSGTDLSLIGKMASELDWSDLVSLSITRRGLVSSQKLYQMLRVLTKERHFEELQLPTAVVATDLLTGQEVVIKSGLIADGVRASLSIPGVFIPVERQGRILVDGALVNRVPVNVCRDLGADFVIGVDVGIGPLRKTIRNLSDVITNTIQILEGELFLLKPVLAEVVIEPDLGNVTPTQLNRAEEIIEKGRQAALANIDLIKELLNSSG